ncbi:hypothetical protein DMC14_001590 [Metamycoplasma phocicerebrale]|uniref:Uncharacterized protein n=1 Tax=Metamycoplasma phocicerebrale TaxID=142649 RepID=A0A3Q9V961_9BACT|nr:hypothetical protein [Metamycoplasma phocicerebrale]AZZ65478.2 hypothetical protein DMC14_001590 [Metamycoplasma phocicerebrale]
MNFENLKYIEQKINDCTTFGQFFKIILKVLNINITKLSIEIKADRRKLINLLYDNKSDVSLNLMQDVEDYFNLETGYLTDKWYFFKNKKIYDYDENKSESLIKVFGWEVLEKNPYIFNTLNNVEPIKELTTEEKLNLIKRFYGTLDPEAYLEDVQKHLYIHKCKIFKPYRLPFIRYCELFIKDYFKDLNGKTFKLSNNLTKSFIVEIFDILFSNKMEFKDKFERASFLLYQRGVEIIKLPYVEKSFTRAISFTYGKKKYIILTDMYNSEILILFALIREIISWFYPLLTKDEYYDLFKKYYSSWKNKHKGTKLEMA